MIDNSFLGAIRIAYEFARDFYPHTFRQFRNDSVGWIKAGSPHSWIRVESRQGVEVYHDTGHGHLAAYYNDKVVGWSVKGQYPIVTPLFVVLDKDYYSVHKYVWF
jgi:hypothetical protein